MNTTKTQIANSNSHLAREWIIIQFIIINSTKGTSSKDVGCEKLPI